jgi:hypothetical protein
MMGQIKQLDSIGTLSKGSEVVAVAAEKSTVTVSVRWTRPAFSEEAQKQ